MANTELDLRSNGSLLIRYDYGVSDVVTWSDMPVLDSGYTLILDEGLITEVVYTVGSGLTLGTLSLAWTLDTSTLQNKTYKGYLVSDSRVLGIYYKLGITIVLE